jgi:hypothetical protein
MAMKGLVFPEHVGGQLSCYGLDGDLTKRPMSPDSDVVKTVTRMSGGECLFGSTYTTIETTLAMTAAPRTEVRINHRVFAVAPPGAGIVPAAVAAAALAAAALTVSDSPAVAVNAAVPMLCRCSFGARGF